MHSVEKKIKTDQGTFSVLFAMPSYLEFNEEEKIVRRELRKKRKQAIRELNNIDSTTQLSIEHIISDLKRLAYAKEHYLVKPLISRITRNHSVLKYNIRNLDRLYALIFNYKNTDDDPTIRGISSKITRYKVFISRVLKYLSKYLTYFRDYGDYYRKEFNLMTDEILCQLTTIHYMAEFSNIIERKNKC